MQKYDTIPFNWWVWIIVYRRYKILLTLYRNKLRIQLIENESILPEWSFLVDFYCATTEMTVKPKIILFCVLCFTLFPKYIFFTISQRISSQLYFISSRYSWTKTYVYFQFNSMIFEVLMKENVIRFFKRQSVTDDKFIFSRKMTW